MTNTKKVKSSSKVNVRKLTVTAILAAASTVLMFLSFNVPLMPSFIKLDLSELPALIASFALGPLSGAAVCLVKNLVNVMFTTTAGVGELCNFLLGCAFVVPAGLIYKHKKSRASALVGSLIGAAAMAILGVFVNYFITYPMYSNFIPMDAIIGMYKTINPNVQNLWDCLLIFNLPFTFIKGLISVAVSFAVYKKLSPILHGKTPKGANS